MRTILRSRMLVIDFGDETGAEEVGGLLCVLKSRLACVLVAVLVGVQAKVACEPACGSGDGVPSFSPCEDCWRKPSSYSCFRMRLKRVLMSLLSPLDSSTTRLRFLPAMIDALNGSPDVIPVYAVAKSSNRCDGVVSAMTVVCLKKCGVLVDARC